MAASTKHENSKQSLLDFWQPPAGSGAPIGCIATSYTFHASVFEDDCLARFIGMEMERDIDDVAWLIEREERLSTVDCMAVLVDAQYCRRKQSLRWDLLPVLVPNGVLHAKIWLMLWSNHLRIVVGSANLTDDGCRKNQEVAGVLEYAKGTVTPRSCLEPILEFLTEIIDLSGDGPAARRCYSLIERARVLSSDWGSSEDDVSVVPILSGPKKPSIFEQLKESWGWFLVDVPDKAKVTSPFFDSHKAKSNAPAGVLREWMKGNQGASIEWNLPVRRSSENEGSVQVRAPENLLPDSESQWAGADIYYEVIEVLDEDGDRVYRPFHAKMLYLSCKGWILFLIGSSNFTSAGYGLGKRTNYEANLLYVTNRKEERKRASVLENCALKTEKIPEGMHLWEWMPDEDETESIEGEAVYYPLPNGFNKAVLFYRNGHYELELTFRPEELPQKDWFIYTEHHSDRLILDSHRWAEMGRLKEVPIVLDDKDALLSALEIVIPETGMRFWWPVEVEQENTFPKPEILRELDLDVLIRFLTSSRSLYKLISKKIRNLQSPDDPDTHIFTEDFHGRVDTRNFLLQRIRRVSWALTGLRERLEKPIYTTNSLHWRLRGPVGPWALAQALIRETKKLDDPEIAAAERAFVMAELALELVHTRVSDDHGTLPDKEFYASLSEILNKILQENQNSIESIKNIALRDYVNTVSHTVRSKMKEWNV